MRHRNMFIAIASSVLLGLTAAQPAHAQLLKGVVGSGGDDKALVDVKVGTSDKKLVDVKVGGSSSGSSGGNVVDATVGGSSGPSASVNVSSSSDDGTSATVATDALGGAEGSLTLLGPDGLVTGGIDAVGVEVDLGIDAGLVPGGPGVPGAPGSSGDPGASGASGGTFGIGGPSGFASLSPADLACMGPDAARLLQIAQQSAPVEQWQRASNVRIVRIDVCPEARNKLLSAMRSSGLGSILWSAAARDTLIAASLSRTSYGAENVLAVQQTGNELTVYVI